MIRLVLVDDQEVIRAGLRAILSDHADIDVVGEVGDGLSAVRIVDDLTPDVVLMDLRMPGIDGVEATRRIRTSHPAHAVRVLVLTTFDQDENVLAALRVGADGFLSKGASPVELVDGILRVARGENALSRRIEVPQLDDLGNVMRMSERSGAQIYASLRARATAMRSESLSDQRAKANAVSERLVLPTTVAGFVFLIIFITPAILRFATTV